MQLHAAAAWMFLGSVVLGVFFTSSLLVDDRRHVELSLTKVYSALHMAWWMVALEAAMHDFMNRSFSWRYYLGSALGIAATVVVSRLQLGVGRDQYLRAMIQHHSSAILTSRSILRKTGDAEVRALASHILRAQEREIERMETLLGSRSK